MSKATIEQQGLLQPESFDLDDLEASEPVQNGHARHPTEDWSRPRKTWTSPGPSCLRPRYVLLGLASVAALLIVGVALNKGKGFKIPKPTWRPPPPKAPELGGGSNTSHGPSGIGAKVKQWEKPEGFKIIGLIFFGRPSVVAILDCYLKKNLVTNGGWLDEVRFMVNTKNEDDIAYLDELVETEALYTKIVISELGYKQAWGKGVDRENLYIKIDDDIVRPLPVLLIRCYHGRLIRGEDRYISTTKQSLTSSLPNLTTLIPSTSSRTSSTARKRAGYTTASELFMPISLSWNLR